jgi:VWFA-related protein
MRIHKPSPGSPVKVEKSMRSAKKAIPSGMVMVLVSLAGMLLLSAGAPTYPRASWLEIPAQQLPPAKKGQEPYKIGVEVNLVMVPVTVRKPGGGFVKELPKSAFHLLEDGTEQEIINFAEESTGARIAIVLDASGSVQDEWDAIKSSTLKFAETLHPLDRFALITFNTKPSLRMDWTNQPDRLGKVLASITCEDNTNLWDAITFVADKVFAGITDKKAMILMSDGLDNGSAISYEDALSKAVHCEAAIYVVSKTQAVRQAMIRAAVKSGSQNIPIRAVDFVEADMALRKLAYQTGGRVLYPSNLEELGDVYEEVRDELSNQYLLGYVSTNPFKDGTYRRIEVSVETPDAQVSARPGYYAVSRSPTTKKQ